MDVKEREFWLSDIHTVDIVELADGQGGLDQNLYLTMRDGTRVKIFSGQLFSIRDRSVREAKVRGVRLCFSVVCY